MYNYPYLNSYIHFTTRRHGIWNHLFKDNVHAQKQIKQTLMENQISEFSVPKAKEKKRKDTTKSKASKNERKYTTECNLIINNRW